MTRHAGRVARGALPLMFAAAAAFATGCAPYPGLPPAPRTTPPAAGATPPVTAGGPATTGPAAETAQIDTVPSREAAEVLARIPEPLRPEERVPPAEAPVPSSRETPPAPSGGSATPADSDAVPVPAPTYPLGLEPPPPPDSTVAPVDSAAQATPAAPSSAVAPPASAPRPSPPPSSTPPAAAAPARAAPPAAADTCWRVQFAAPDEKGKAERLRDAAESQLDVPAVIEREGGLHKVRTRDCMGAAAADALRRRADSSGFTGAFRFRGARR